MAEQKVIMTDPRQEDYFYQEAIKTLRTNIQFAGMDVKTILFTSCYPVSYTHLTLPTICSV